MSNNIKFLEHERKKERNFVMSYNAYSVYNTILDRLPALPILPVNSFIFTILSVNFKHDKNSTLVIINHLLSSDFKGPDKVEYHKEIMGLLLLFG
jgi:hypothetical protein